MRAGGGLDDLDGVGFEHPREQAGGGLRLAELRLAHTADRTFPTRVSDYIRAVAETTDEQASQLAVEAAGHRWPGRSGWAALHDAATIWAAHAACLCADGLIDVPHDARRRQEPLARARSKLGYERAQAAERRGAAMSLATAAEYELLLAAGDPATPQAPPELSQLSPREHELVTLVARGGTNAQIAIQLYISIRTVGSHLDPIRDKTGCRRCTDLTRLALQAGLV